VPAAPAVDYAVRLARPAAAGEKRLAVGSLENDDHLAGKKAGAASDQRQTATIDYVVATEILEVSAIGNVLRAAKAGGGGERRAGGGGAGLRAGGRAPRPGPADGPGGGAAVARRRGADRRRPLRDHAAPAGGRERAGQRRALRQVRRGERHLRAERRGRHGHPGGRQA